MSLQYASPAGLSDRSAGKQISPVFPKTRNSLWDKTSRGQPIFLHVGHYRKPRICVPEKILKLVQHQCENYGQCSYVLLGSLVIDADGEGVQVQVDRLDTRTNIPLTSVDLTVGSVAVSFQVTNNAACERAASADDYVHALKLLQSRCCGKDSIDLSEFIYLCGYGSFYSNAHTTVAHLDFDLLTLATVFKCTPITPVPVAVTALSKNLATPRNLSSLQGTPKTGYLTMDSTRKVMLVLESDPKCVSLPIVGIWVSGVEFLHHPFVWAACLRYIHCTHLQDRVCAPPEEFLLALYRPLQTRPEFYQCASSFGDSCLQFGLSTGHKTINMDKVLASPSSGDFVEVEMGLVEDEQKREIFDAAKQQHSNSVFVKDPGFAGQEDLEPRSAPVPHAEKVPVFRPQVPDVSVLWTDQYEHFTSPAPVPAMPSNKLASWQNPAARSQVEPLSEQHYPEHSFSRPHLTTTLDSQRLTGHYQQPQVLQTRSPLSFQYTPSRQHLGAAAPNTQQLLPSSPHSSHNFYVNDKGISPTPTAVTHGYLSNPQNMSPHLVTTPGLLRHCTPPAPQTSQPTPSSHMISSSRTNCLASVAGPSSQNRNQCLPTPTSAHVNSQALPFPQFGSNDHTIHDQNACSSNSPNLNTKKHQNVDHFQFMNTSVANEGQQQGVPSPQVHTQAHNGNWNPPVVFTPQPHPLSSTKGLQNYKESLKTISEEGSLSQTLLPHLEQPSTRMFDVNDHAKTAESNGSSLRLPSINSSVRSSAEDSGLDASSDRLNISLPQHRADSLTPTNSYPATTKTSACTCASASCTQQNPVESIKWEQVPPAVVTLLVQQSELLKQLQQQVQMLKSEIAETNKASPPDQGSPASRNQQKVSVAVNTSFVNHQTAATQDHCDSKATQVTPVRHSSRQQEFTSPAASYVQNSVRVPAEASQTPAGHHITAAASSVGYQSPQGSSSCVQKDVSQREFDRNVSSMQSFERTENTDLESECASFIDRSQSDRSPSSASEYNRQAQESCSTVGVDAADPNQFFCHIMAGSVTMHSMFGTDPNQTTEMNALAMKYLSDEQLTAVAKLRQTAPSRSHSAAYSAKILEQVMNGCTSSMAGNISAADMSHFGMSSCDMTMDTLMYLQKYGLLGNDRSILGVSMLGADVKLRTDFSIMTIGSSAGGTNLSPTTTGDEEQFLQLHEDPEVSSDHVPSPARVEAPAHANNENLLLLNAKPASNQRGMGASLMLPASRNSSKDAQQRYANGDQFKVQGNSRRRNVLQEVSPQAFVNVKTGDHFSPLVKAWSEEEEGEKHSLDLETLKQLPKLL
ncbi:unnamed protein product [Candidula unifasciata]|uniref:STIL N-terminal domain-containing protein n=1 Tax=Candidula unifasciata TaxID=100452 RepID=A0A8S3Z1C2_9EUPU|nr:unnamed protein product [Candidula unifasciata]